MNFVSLREIYFSKILQNYIFRAFPQFKIREAEHVSRDIAEYLFKSETYRSQRLRYILRALFVFCRSLARKRSEIL
ncbi:MAG: hypothetical protein LBK06_07775 [Planctomycetaceae bacterium]|nr:hypothetical protein [Planctomycetaceae bacterium]